MDEWAMRRLILVSLAVLAASSDIAASRARSWRTYADCAAAYRANARMSDPDRAPSMTAMVSEQADDYQKAALRAHRRQAKSSEARTSGIVDSYVARQVDALAARPRTEVERLIDACPQPDS